MHKPKRLPRFRRKKSAQTEKRQAELFTLVGQNIEAILEYQLRSEQKVDQHQRVIERLTRSVGRPRFLYLTLLFVLLWILLQGLLIHFGLSSFDPPPFSWLQGLISISALLLTTMVLTTQNRQEKYTEQQRHLDLQVALLVEQKVTKVIALVEELRRDLPSVSDRYDPQAEAMQEILDPQLVLTTLESMLPEGNFPREDAKQPQDESDNP